MRAAVILLVKNGAAYLPEVLDAVYGQRTDLDLQVIAIDSGSQDGSKNILGRYPLRLVEIPPEEFNHGETRNLGARLAGAETDFLVYLTQDATPQDEDWLENLVAPLREDGRVAGAFSRHVPRPTSSPSLARQLAASWQSGGQVRLIKEMPADLSAYQQRVLFYAYFSNTSSVLRRSVWEQIPFRRVDFAEDMDWADRVLRAGYRIVYEPSSVVVHSHDYSLTEQFRQNVDHMAGMKQLMPAQIPRGLGGWLRVFGGIPRETWRDWRFTWSAAPFAGKPLAHKVRWMLHSPAWHVASAWGAWAGAHLDLLPLPARSFLSRQTRLRSEGR